VKRKKKEHWHKAWPRQPGSLLQKERNSKMAT
jgi:hypothetical protein